MGDFIKMIIDIHTHTFPDEIASRAINKLSDSSNAIYYLDGTLNSLKHSAKMAGIDYCVLQPVATRPSQSDSIATTAILINEQATETGIFSFGGIHPDNTDYADILRRLRDGGVKGIKIHPVFQDVFIDDKRYLNIISKASEYDMAVMIHAGYDISFGTANQASPSHVLNMLNELKPPKVILAHMGGWGCWNEVEQILCGKNVYFDTAYSISPIVYKDPSKGFGPKKEQLSMLQFVHMVRSHGDDRVLFGTDSPWENQSESVMRIKNANLYSSEKEQILYENAAELLGLS